jgi:hypothetical protein
MSFANEFSGDVLTPRGVHIHQSRDTLHSGLSALAAINESRNRRRDP